MITQHIEFLNQLVVVYTPSPPLSPPQSVSRKRYLPKAEISQIFGVDKIEKQEYNVPIGYKGKGVSMTDIISAKKAAEELGYHVKHMYRLLREGKIKGERIGGGWAVDVLSVAQAKARQDDNGRIEWEN